MESQNITPNASLGTCGFGETVTDTIAAKIAAYVFIIVTSVIGNTLVCLVVYKNKEMRSTINYIIVNIAASDVLIPFFGILPKVLELATGSLEWRVRGEMGNFLCKFVFFVADLSPIVSITSLVFLTSERFAAVFYPFKVSQISPRIRKLGIAITWITAIAFTSPHFYTFRLNESGCCVMDWGPAFDHATARHAYISILLFAFIIIPFGFMAILYSLILYKLQAKTMFKQGQRERKKRERVKRNVTLLSFGIVLAFGLCWGPYFTILIIVSYVWKWNFVKLPRYWDTLWFTAQYMSYSNALVNPLLCLIFMRNFREGAKKLFPFRGIYFSSLNKGTPMKTLKQSGYNSDRSRSKSSFRSAYEMYTTTV